MQRSFYDVCVAPYSIIFIYPCIRALFCDIFAYLIPRVEESRFGQLATTGILFVALASSNNEHANDRPKIDIGAIRIFLRLAVLRARV